ncbi:MAG TPA: four helix bundle protein [Pontiellaceae bacterium]|nr:four helix bundle protein [Pontiellaceae bacterium]
MAYQSFEDLEVWKLSLDLSVRLYERLGGCKDFGFKDQICRAAVSVPSNIAEGIERNSKKETIHFLHIAKGSCAEVRTQLIIARRIGYIDYANAEKMTADAVSVSRMLHGLIKALGDAH